MGWLVGVCDLGGGVRRARWWIGMEGMEGREGMGLGVVRNGELWVNMEELRRQAGTARLGGGGG